LLPFQLVIGGPCSVPACHACLVAGSAATSAGGRRCPPSARLPCLPLGAGIYRPFGRWAVVPTWLSACFPLRAQCLGLLPFRLVGGGARMVPALHCLLAGWQFGWLVFWLLDLLPFQLVDDGPCLVPAGCAASSAGGRRVPSACSARLPGGGWFALLACLLHLLLFGEGALPA
jgi:hypothetical protein